MKAKLTRKDYSFSCGIECYQQELTLKQDKALAKLLSQFKFDSDKMSLMDIIAALSESDLLNEALGIILNKQADYSNLTNSELEQVITDFFSLNPSLRKLFKIGNKEAAGS